MREDRISGLESNLDYIEGSNVGNENPCNEYLMSKIDDELAMKGFEAQKRSAERGEAHGNFKKYFKDSVTKKFLDQGKIPDKAQHKEIMVKLKSLIRVSGRFEDQDPYTQTAINTYKEFAAIRFLEDSIQRLIKSGRMPNNEEQEHILNMFPKVREGLGKHLEKNPGLKQDYERISKAYLDLLETKRKVEKSTENIDSPLIETEQKEDEEACDDYPSRLRQLDSLIQSGQELNHKGIMEEFKAIYFGLTAEKIFDQQQYLKEVFTRYKALFKAEYEKAVAQKKVELDEIIEKSPDYKEGVPLEIGRWRTHLGEEIKITKMQGSVVEVLEDYTRQILHTPDHVSKTMLKEKLDDK